MPAGPRDEDDGGDARADGPLDGIARGWGKRLAATARVAGQAARLAVKRADRDGAIGDALARELDQMKGVAMKVGQILSYFDGVLPAETHAALRRLQRGAAPVKLEVMLQVIADAFGAPVGALPGALFDRFDPEPVASASIGQVYRGHCLGREVAVKVQYPRVRETMVADVGRLRALSRIASMATAVDGPGLVDELGERMARECDYLLEARFQRAFRAALAGDAQVYVPEVVDARTRATVLTTEWIQGQSFYDVARTAGAADRGRIGLVLARFAYGSLFGLGTLNADPHPGNYLFPAGGPVVFIDFGCVRAFEPDFIERERALARVVIEDRRSAFRDALVATGMVPRPERFDFDSHWSLLCHQYAPYRQPRFAFTFDYLRGGMQLTGPSNPNLRRLAIPPPWIWVQRLIWGLHAVLARLGAEGAFAEVLRTALDTPIVMLPVAPDEKATP
jgi:predicted unusual protein kinase regulating ubiquinone biosynthesis (AarF/ABC1/UbiB family)